MSSSPPTHPGSPPQAEEPVPRIPDNELLFPIAKGAYGEIWLARNVVGTLRAVKVVRRDRFDEDRPYEREFEGIRNYEPVSRKHERLIDILQVGRDDAAGYFYYAMELADDACDGAGSADETPSVPGTEASLDRLSRYTPRTLSAEIRRRGRLPIDECIGLGVDLCDALDCLHQAGLVHRDIKPSNIVFVRGVPRLADIGLVADAGRSDSLVGTEGYIPPEGSGTVQADIYSLGKVLYEAVTSKDRRRFPEPLTQMADLPDRDALAEFNEVILKACALDPRDRYTSAVAMQTDLLLLRRGASIRGMRRLEGRLRRLKRIATATALLVVVSGSAFLWQRHQSRVIGELASESQARLVRLGIVQGLKLMEEGDYLGSLVWFGESLRQERNPEEQRLQRMRLATIRRQCPTLVRLGRHDQAINHADFSKDGRRILTTSDDGTARVWDLSSGKEVARVSHDGRPIQHASFSPDGGRFVTAGDDGTARAWEATTGQPLLSPLPHGGPVVGAVFSPDGRQIATACEDGNGRIWDLASGTLACPLLRQEGPVASVLFSPNGQRLATVSGDGTAVLWDPLTGNTIGTPLRHPSMVGCAAFSPDGRMLVTGCDDGISRRWDVTMRVELAPPMAQTGKVRFVTFSVDGRMILTAGGSHLRDGEARVWDADTGQPITAPLRHASHVSHATFSPDGRWVVTGSSDRTARIWDVSTGQRAGSAIHLPLAVWLAQFSPDGRSVLTAGRDGIWRLWNMPSALPGADKPALAQLQRMFSPPAWEWVRRHSTDPSSVKAAVPNKVLTVSPDGRRLLVLNESRSVQVWDANTLRPMSKAMEQPTTVHTATFSPDSRLVVTGGEDGVARLWDAASGDLALPSLRHADFRVITSAVFSPDGRRLVTGARDDPNLPTRGSVGVWWVGSGEPAGPVQQLPGGAGEIAISPDGQLIATCTGTTPGSGASAYLWRMADMSPVQGSPYAHPDSVTGVVFNPDGGSLATSCADGYVRVWAVAKGRLVRQFASGSRSLTSIAFADDGRRLATGSTDGPVQVWDWAAGEPLGPPLWHNTRVRNVALSPDGASIIGSGWDWTCRVRDIGEESGRFEDLEKLSSFMAQRRLDESGRLQPHAFEDLTGALEGLQTRFPERFAFRSIRPEDFRSQ